MGVRTALATGAGRVTSWGLRRVFHRNASQLPGRVALAIDPDVIGHLAGKVGKGSIVVCGTNGKTTTNNVLAAAVEASDQSVLCNRAGANMAAGVAAAMLPGSGADWAVMESDELSTIHVLPQLRPSYLVLLNLFRDQLDRAGEIDHVQDTIVAALAASPTTTLLACGDDPLCMGVARRAAEAGTRVLTFGIGEDLGLEPDRVPEARFCQVCGAELAYDYRTYAQLGAFRCPNGDFERPELDVAATNIHVDRTGVEFDAAGLGLDGEVHVRAGFGGVYMVYNLLAALAAANLAGVGGDDFQRALDGYDPKNGRLQHFDVNGREVVLNLAKNPTGFNQNISLLEADERPKAAFFVINDDFNDGKDISWIWDVDFERLAGDPDLQVIAGGHRANDVQVRLKYAGITAPIAANVGGALALVSAADGAGAGRDGAAGGDGAAGDAGDDAGKADGSSRPLYVLTNYSALWIAKAELEKMGERRD